MILDGVVLALEHFLLEFEVLLLKRLQLLLEIQAAPLRLLREVDVVY